MLGGAWLVMIPAMRQLILSTAVAWWFASLLIIRQYEFDPRQVRWLVGSAVQFHPSWLLGMLGVIVLVPPWLSLLVLHGSATPGSALVLMLMALVWTADSGAYAAGRLWGRTKVAPKVSPGKTWEGVYGGMAAAALTAVIAGQWIGFGWRTQVSLVLLGIVTVLFSIIGDLFESLIKRMAGVKDSGRLLPGHGGVLDRIDSVTAAAPVFALGLLWQGMIT
jgi:phosphatidate cytidylyltransferase